MAVLILVERKEQCRLFHAVTLLELINTSAAVNEFLAAGVEGVALGADFNSDVLLGGAGLDDGAASALDSGLLVLRMDSFLHAIHLFPAQVYHLCIIICWIQYHSSFSVSYAHLNFNGFFDVMRFWHDFLRK